MQSKLFNGINLGLTQFEISMWLGIRRSDWALFVTNRKKISSNKLLEISKLLDYLKQSKKELIEDGNLVIKALEKRLKEVNYQHLKTRRQLTQIIQKREKLKKSWNALQYLLTQNNIQRGVIKIIDYRIEKGLSKYSNSDFELTTIKLKALESEQDHLIKTINLYKTTKKKSR